MKPDNRPGLACIVRDLRDPDSSRIYKRGDIVCLGSIDEQDAEFEQLRRAFTEAERRTRHSEAFDDGVMEMLFGDPHART